MINYFFTLLLLIFTLSSCDPPEERWKYQGDITTLRIDDDGEYHFSTDYDAFHDESHYTIKLERQDIPNPQLYIKQNRCPQGKFCSEGSKEWQYIFIEKKIILQLNSILNKFC